MARAKAMARAVASKVHEVQKTDRATLADKRFSDMLAYPKLY
jgi:hypothetical protein